MNRLAPNQNGLAGPERETPKEVSLSDYVNTMMGCSALAACGEGPAYHVMTQHEIAQARAARLAMSSQLIESID